MKSLYGMDFPLSRQRQAAAKRPRSGLWAASGIPQRLHFQNGLARYFHVPFTARWDKGERPILRGMKLVLLTYGSMGDVLPYAALGRALAQAGHSVRVAAPMNFESSIRRLGLEYAPLFGDTREILESDSGRRWLAAAGPLRFFREMNRIARSLRGQLETDIPSACDGADAIVAHTLLAGAAATISEWRGIPVLPVFQIPLGPATRAFPHPLTEAFLKLPSALNRESFRLFFRLFDRGQRESLNAWRAQLGLGSIRGSLLGRLLDGRSVILHAYSGHLIPRPSEWGPEQVLTGSWQGDALTRHAMGLDTDPELEEWLGTGDPPVYFGFGSMPVDDGRALVDLTVQVAGELGVRAVIAGGWSRIASDRRDLPESVYCARMVDHARLFPRCRAVVHHGGAGTTAAGLTAGMPTLVCSVFADQPFWGERVTKLEVGRHLPLRRLTRERLRQSLKKILAPNVQSNAAAMGRKLQSEQGVHTAVDTIERWFPNAPPFCQM